MIRDSCKTSKTLAVLSHGAERLFWRLTTEAADFGRFEAHPLVVLTSCMPRLIDRVTADDVATWLDEMVRCDLIAMYEVRGRNYAVFLTFGTHQRKRARYSKYPPPPDDICARLSADDGEWPADDDDGGHSRPRSEKREARSEKREVTTVGSGDPPWPSPEALVALYNRLAPEGHPQVGSLSPGRKHKAKQYLAVFPEQSFWVRVFSEIRHSSFLRGLNNGDGHKHFRGDFDWLLTKGKDQTENVVKVAEGKYRDTQERR